MQIEINIPSFWYNPKHPETLQFQLSHPINIPYCSQIIKLSIQEPPLNNPDIINNAVKIIKKNKCKNEKTNKSGDLLHIYEYPDYDKMVLEAEKKKYQKSEAKRIRRYSIKHRYFIQKGYHRKLDYNQRGPRNN